MMYAVLHGGRLVLMYTSAPVSGLCGAAATSNFRE